jgi:hypothetical protein
MATTKGSQPRRPPEEPTSKLELPFARAFVVQFFAASSRTVPRFAGRVEHLHTGRRAGFASRRTLLSLLDAMLVEQDRRLHPDGPGGRTDSRRSRASSPASPGTKPKPGARRTR